MYIISEAYKEVSFKIDDEVRKKIGSKKVREKMKEQYGDKAFLDPDELKFPVVNPNNGKYDCKLIYGAFLRASVYSSKGGSKEKSKEYYDKIRDKAKDIYQSNDCSDKIKMKLSKEDEQQYDIMYLNMIFNLTKEDCDIIEQQTEFLDLK